MQTQKEQIKEFYDHAGDAFDESYDLDGPLYPSNLIRAQHTIEVLKQRNVPTVLDAGCGTGVVSAMMHEAGLEVTGFDFAPSALQKARERWDERGLNPEAFTVDDIESMQYSDHQFDAAIVMGALTHPIDHTKALSELHRVVSPGGTIVVELRNKLFSLFTANMFTGQMMKEMMPVGSELSRHVTIAIDEMYRGGITWHDTQGTMIEAQYKTFFDIPHVWKNPLTIHEEYHAAHFHIDELLFFHWHIAPPRFEDRDAKEFRRASLEMEKYPRDWRGLFMCSAFLVVATAT